MQRKIADLKIIASGLAVLYATSILIYLQAYRIAQFQTHASVLIGLFAALLISALGALFIQGWGRLGLVYINVFLGLYLLRLYVEYSDFIPMSYVFMSIIICTFFNLTKTKIRFKSQNWQSILVVDDDETLLKTVRPILMTHGFSVLTATTGEDGLTIVKNQKPDLVILDVILPKMKGREVCKAIKENEETKNIPVIFLTAKDSPDDIQAEMEAGAETHLTKPVDAKLLVSTVRSVLR